MVYLKYVRKDVHERLNNSELAGFAIAAVTGARPQRVQVARAG